jgi:tetratricopeptide (TPR) repeat protein
LIEYKNALNSPNDAKAHYGLAQARGDRAQKAFRSCGKRYVSTAATSTRVARPVPAVRSQDEFEQALGRRSGDEADQSRWEGHVIHAVALERLKRVDEAGRLQEGARAATRTRTGARSPATTCARAIAHRGRSSELVRWIRRAEPASTAAFAATGRATMRGCLQNSLRREGGEPGRVVQRVASYYYARERYDEAEKTLKDALEVRKDDLDLIYSLARFFNSRGDKAKADSMIEQATSAKPDDPKPFLILSAIVA